MVQLSRKPVRAAIDKARSARAPRLSGQALVLCLYVLIAFWLTLGLWANPAVRVPALSPGGISNDIFLNDWFMSYAAAAVAHGHLPALVTTALNAPQGINVMWNTSFLLPGVLLAPVTLLAGPQVSLTIAVTAGFAGSAASMFWVLRRWRASISAAAIGGAVYGFSPALRMAAQDHYHLQFAVLLPLIIDAVLRILVGRGRPWLTGIWLGVLLAAQLFIAEEMLVAVGLASVLAVVVLMLSRPRSIRGRLLGALTGLGVATGVLALLAGYALWVQFFGPLTEHSSPWNVQRYSGSLQDFVTAPTGMLFHGSGFLQFLLTSDQRYSEYFGYLGWPLLGVLLAVAVVGWSDVRIRISAIAFAGLELCSLGAHQVVFDGRHLPVTLLPWHWLGGLPMLSQALPNRLSIVADAAAGAMLAFAIDRARAFLPDWPRRWRAPAVAAVTALALLPLIPLIPLRLPTTPMTLPPPAWDKVLAGLHLTDNARLLVLPQSDAVTMSFEANSANPFSIIGGYCIAPRPDGRAAGCDLLTNPVEHQVLLKTHQMTTGAPWARQPSHAMMSAALADWQPAAVVAEVSPRSWLGRYLTGYFGRPTARADGILGWRVTSLAPLAVHAARDSGSRA